MTQIPSNDTPLVSVIMPVYNEEQYLVESIESIRDQTFSDFELIIISDDTKESVKKILDHFGSIDNRIKIFYFEREGLITALNRGCNIASGEFIARMDADDISKRERLEKQVNYLRSNSDVGVVGSWVEYIDKNYKVMYKPRFPCHANTIKFQLFFYCPLAHPSVMFRRNLFSQIGGYDPNYCYAEDYDLWVRMCKITKISNIPEKLLLYRIQENSISTKFSAQQILTSNKVRKQLLVSLLNNDESEDSLNIFCHWLTNHKVFNINSINIIEDVLFKIFKQFVSQNNLTKQEFNEIHELFFFQLIELAMASISISPFKSLRLINKMFRSNPTAALHAPIQYIILKITYITPSFRRYRHS